MNRISCLITLLTLSACNAPDESSGTQALELRIARIENGLTPVLQIKGHEIPTFNIEDRLAELNIPGLSVAFVANGKIEWERAYGMADIGENRPFADTNDVTFDKFLYHLTTIFTDVRLNLKGPSLELRTLDSLPLSEFMGKWDLFVSVFEHNVKE